MMIPFPPLRWLFIGWVFKKLTGIWFARRDANRGEYLGDYMALDHEVGAPFFVKVPHLPKTVETVDDFLHWIDHDPVARSVKPEDFQ